MTGAMILQKFNPRTLSIVSIGAAMISDIIIRKMQNFIIPRLTINEKPFRETTIIGRIANRINSYFQKQDEIARVNTKREKYLERRTGRFMTFLFAVFCYLPVIPDIISTRLLYKKIRFPYFIIATVIGKGITHIPFIFLGKSIAQILHLWI
jgi:hypothetical protein